MTKLLWQPSKDVVDNSNITKFIELINSKYKLKLKDYNDLYEFSISEISKFWETIWEYSGIVYSIKYTNVVTDLNKFPPKTKWFINSKLNFAENLLRFRDKRTAILFRLENNKTTSISYKELYNKVSKIVKSMRKMGIKPGDRVTAYMPNIPETVIFMLAATAIGATWASCGAELGKGAALDRLGQIEPRIIFSIDAYIYKGKVFDHLDKIRYVANNISSIEKVIILPYVNDNPNLDALDNSQLLSDFEDDETAEIEFEQLPFEHPLFIMFSSGTTGKPKCMVQSTGGVLINHLKELLLHTDIRRDDKLFYISSPSWMMWNWSVSTLATGATLVLFDGNPFYPDWKTIWNYIDDEGITIFGCSATYIHHMNNIKSSPMKEFKLNKLREISQTGSALSDEGYDYVYNEIKNNIHLNSISGGTDINGCFAAGSPTLPVYSGELQVRALGMKVMAYDLDANPVFDTKGELVCETASPSMPIYFWNDKNNERYFNSYFTYFEEKLVWRHGDYVKISSKTGGVTFGGRSDSVLKPSGVRIGTAELYNILEGFDEISSSLAIGQQFNNDQRIILFITLSEGNTLDDDLVKRIRYDLKTKGSPRHVPAKIIVVPDIPYTFSGKKVESAVTNIIHGREVTNKGAMRNPECLQFYREILKELEK